MWLQCSAHYGMQDGSHTVQDDGKTQLAPNGKYQANPSMLVPLQPTSRLRSWQRFGDRPATTIWEQAWPRVSWLTPYDERSTGSEGMAKASKLACSSPSPVEAYGRKREADKQGTRSAATCVPSVAKGQTQSFTEHGNVKSFSKQPSQTLKPPTTYEKKHNKKLQNSRAYG